MEIQTEASITPMNVEENPQKMTLEQLNWENFKCQRHPFKVDALSVNEDDPSDAKLLCLKCIVEGDYFSSSSRKLVTIKDLIQKCSEGGQNYNNVISKPNDGLQEKFLDFMTHDYMRTYEKHLEDQHRNIDQEIKGVMENLGKLRDRYNSLYAEELVALRMKAEDIKKKIRRHLEENSSSGDMTFSSLNQMLQQFTTLQSTGQFCEFLTSLYFKSKGVTESKTDTQYDSQIVKTLEEFKLKALNLDEKVAETNYFQEMNRTVNLLLGSEDHMFKKVKNLGTASTPKIFDHSQIKLEFQTPSASTFKIKEPTPSISDDIFVSLSTSETFRPRDPLMMVKNKKSKYFGCDLDSQSLRNLKKDLDEKENSDPLGTNHKKERTMNALSDWINRRITGYLIFQNTINSNEKTRKEKSECSELGVHFNQMIGHKWKSMTRSERDEYQNIAKEYRQRFRKEMVEREDSEDLSDLFSQFDQQIKKIKKE